ncbi:head-tail connector protein [Candidatus Pacearchaeota archaeon]|nr:head-tail connector protein [Candidatus Pacearchaeota archaeon]
MHPPFFKGHIMRYEWNSKYIITTDNTELIVSLEDMKAYLKVDSSADDALITSMIITSQQLIERYIRRELLNKTFTMFLDFFPYYKAYGSTIEGNFNNYTIQVKRSKLNTLNSIQYFTDNVLTTLDASLYDFTVDNDYSRIYLLDRSALWPTTDERKQSVQIEFIAGYGDAASDVPEALKTAIKIIVAYMYENRGDCVVSNIRSDLIMLSGASIILDFYKILEI